MDGLMATSEANPLVKEAKLRFERAREAYSASRMLAAQDTRFAMGDSDNYWQWPEEIRNTRKLDKRVCLTVNLTAQHCNQIINAIRQNRPAVKVSPADDSADKKTAEILGGLIRNIQVQSAADEAHDVAAEHSVYGGEGYWRIVTEYESPDSFNQVIKIKAVPNPSLVYIDPDCKELDKSDANWGFIFEDITKEQAKREHPEIDPQSWADDGKHSDWVSDETFRRAEYFWCEYEKDTACLLHDGSTCLKSQLPPGAVVVKERPTEVKKWRWCKLVGGHDEPIDETEWLGDFLPIIAVVGKEVNVDGEIVRKGIVRDLKDPARMVNFAYSETVQTLALQNKVPYMAAAEAIEGYEDVWRSANVENQAYLPFNAYDEAGNALPRPERQQPAVMPAAQVQLLQLSTEEMRAASGQQNSNFGIKSEASSGIGIQRLKVQGEIATFHFPDNLARALRYEAKVLIDLIQKYYDTARIVRILGLDGQQSQAMLDPAHPQPHTDLSEISESDVTAIFNPTVGKYDVVIDTGPAFQTQRQEAFAALTEMAGRNPALMQVAGDLIMRAADFPMADQLAERLAKMLPPQLQEQKGQPQIPPEVMQKMQLLTQQLDHTGAALEEAHRQLQEAKQGNAADMQKVEMQARIKAAELAAEIEAKQKAAEIDARLALEKAQKDAEVKVQIAAMNIEADQEIEELKGYVELQKVRMAPPSPAMTADVEGDFDNEAEEPPLPKILMRKRMKIMAPSGSMYEGTIEDEPINEGGM